MIEMFQNYISPFSPERAKLAIHLHAKAVSGVSSIELGAGTTVSDTPTTIKPSKGLYIIEDARDYKSQLAVTAGPQPVKDLNQFEDVDPNC